MPRSVVFNRPEERLVYDSLTILDLASAGYLLRVAARDVSTGNIGAVNILTGKLKPEPPPAPKPLLRAGAEKK